MRMSTFKSHVKDAKKFFASFCYILGYGLMNAMSTVVTELCHTPTEKLRAASVCDTLRVCVASRRERTEVRTTLRRTMLYLYL